MDATLKWEEARQGRARKLREKSKNVFAGGFATDVARISAVTVVRLSVWPEGQTVAPASYALVPPDKSKDADEDFPEDDSADFGEDEEGVTERRGVSPAAVDDEFADLNTEINWQSNGEAVLPLHLEWQQSAESRWELFFDLQREALCMGLGERMSGLNLRSRRHTLFNTDDDKHVESIDSMYQSIPFLIVSQYDQYYGLFLDSPARQRWDLDADLSGRAHVELLSRRGWQLYCMGPGSLADIVGAYTTLTGRCNLPPLWSLGHQQSRWSYPDQDTAIRIAHEFRSRKIPCDVIVLDIDYMDEYRVFTHSRERFPEFQHLIRDLAVNDFKVITIIDPGVKQDDEFFVFKDGIKHQYFCTKGDGSLFTAPVWPGDSAFPDFVREDVRLWWAAQHGFHTEMGVAGIWNDMNEPAFFNVRYPLAEEAKELPADDEQLFLQETPEGRVGHYEVRNLYGFQMSRATYEGLLALRPGERPFVLTRSGFAGIQRYSAVWLGDNTSWWLHLSKSIPMLVNMGLSGVAFCGVDIGGFWNDATPELLVRWYETGIFYPLFRNHCSMIGANQEPWVFGAEIEQHCRHLIETRYRLLPYIQYLFYEHWRTGAPLMRPLVWHYPNDRVAREVDDQFMFGEDLLVAPILERGKTVRPVYFPEGKWHSFEGTKTFEGGRVELVDMPLGGVPAFVRDGAILPLADPVQSTAQLNESTVTFVCYGKNARGMYYVDDGASFEYQEGAYDLWRLRLDDGRFLAQPVELGYERSPRQFRLAYDGQTKEISLTP